MDTIVLGTDVESGDDFLLKIPDLVTGRTAVIAKTGYGKSWTIRRIVEQLLEKGYPVGVIDPEGEHSSLAEVFDLLVIAPDGDVDLTKASPKRLAQVAVKGVSFVLDLSKYDPEVASDLVASILEELVKIGSEGGFLVVVDEAKELAPERGAGSTLGKHASLTVTWLNTLATRGRKKGIGLLFSTQRPQLVSKTLLSQAENKIVLRVEYSRDISAIVEYLGLSREMARKISKLDRGVAYVEGPFAERPAFVKIGGVRSAHLGSTPSPKPRPPPSLKEVVRFLSVRPEVDITVESKREEFRKEKSHKKVKVSKEEKVPPKRPQKRIVRARKGVAIRSSEVWSLPPARLNSKIVRDLVAERDEMRELLRTLESRKDAMDEAVYDLLREEYEKELSRLEEDLEPYRRDALEAVLVLKAAIEDRRNLIETLSSKKTNLLRKLLVRWRIRRLRGEIKSLKKKLKKAREIQRKLE
ncbi:MAG: DUF87 domain-containing protein [Candidatus Korarchaeota archaeon]|nr:DUF87 domain-containing protein [Candidatus Korarchaeota archaeon]